LLLWPPPQPLPLPLQLKQKPLPPPLQLSNSNSNCNHVPPSLDPKRGGNPVSIPVESDWVLLLWIGTKTGAQTTVRQTTALKDPGMVRFTRTTTVLKKDED
jgi:hypothetical protein